MMRSPISFHDSISGLREGPLQLKSPGLRSKLPISSTANRNVDVHPTSSSQTKG